MNYRSKARRFAPRVLFLLDLIIFSRFMHNLNSVVTSFWSILTTYLFSVVKILFILSSAEKMLLNQVFVRIYCFWPLVDHNWPLVGLQWSKFWSFRTQQKKASEWGFCVNEYCFDHLLVIFDHLWTSNGQYFGHIELSSRKAFEWYVEHVGWRPV